MSVLKLSSVPNTPREGSMEAIFDGDFRRAPATEWGSLKIPRSVSGGSTHDNIDIIIHSNNQPPIVR